MEQTRDFHQSEIPPELPVVAANWAETEWADVVHKDQSRRWRAGKRVLVEEYLAVLPGLALYEDVLVDLIHNELFLREELGERPRAEEYQHRFPQYWSILRVHFSFRPVSVSTQDRSKASVDEHPEDIISARVGRYPILAIISRGGFGVVYRGRDEVLARDVAIKLPHPHRMTSPEDAQAFLAEAQVLAKLNHPGIVPVFDFGQIDDGRCYLVSKLVPGGSLADRLTSDRPPPTEAAELVAAAGEALHHAHQKGLVHRDIKPGNILLEEDGRPVIADFGLALREEDYGRGPTSVGTPAYMSPEQARGEGHLVDGRTDVYGLGVVFYELLTGRRPFHASSLSALLQLVARGDPRPPRQLDDSVPRELDRICVKAMAKRASDRYSTSLDLVEDLRLWLVSLRGDRVVATQESATTVVQDGNTFPDEVNTRPSSSRFVDPIVPRGLRSFEPEDADFFLELLPGPRGRGGIPESIRFWKSQLEETDEDRACRVGLIYGPSGCGKSSLVKAGVLPRLESHVATVYVEATAADTETRLLTGLHRRYPNLPAGLTLAEIMAHLRRGRDLPKGGKLVVVFDQFEQWLHARQDDSGRVLVEALRQCDGVRVQALLLVRDDFWMGISRFMRELEVPLSEGRNSAPADLFDSRHARKVLTAFGRAYGVLPSTDLLPEQAKFLDLAVDGLAEDGKIVPVRLALFSEMMKDKAWTSATWKAVGGAEGVGVSFMEETFGSLSSPPHHRIHQRAARAVLAKLLPETGTEIKGPMRSRAELLEASGYADRPAEYDDLLRILDGELRLVTATDHDPESGESSGSAGNDQRYYQLTHDYLVPVLRQWLTWKQRETRSGRAELRLEELAAAFAARPEKRNLPSWWEWMYLRIFTRKRNWRSTQRTMMRQAARVRGARIVVVLAVMAIFVMGGWEYHSRSRVRTLHDGLLNAFTKDVPAIVDEMEPYRRRLTPLLRQSFVAAEAAGDERKQLHVALALLPSDPGQLDYLYRRLLEARSEEFVVIRKQLLPYAGELRDRLWAELEDSHRDSDRRFHAACALALFEPDSPRWSAFASFVTTKLMDEPALTMKDWVSTLKDIRAFLSPPLAAGLVEEKGGNSRRRTALALFREFASDEDISRLEASLESEQAVDANTVKRRANLAVALVALGRGEKVWPLLVHSPDPTIRSYLIERLAPGGVDLQILATRLRVESDVSARRALILALGEFESGIPEAEQVLLNLYGNHPDAGIHSAAEWVLRKWGREEPMRTVRLCDESVRRWRITSSGQTMTIVQPGRLHLQVQNNGPNQWRDLVIDHSFAIATKEVTVEQFRRFRHKNDQIIAPDNRRPVNELSWFAAAEYCNRLSAAENIPESEWCYQPNAAGVYAEGMTIARDYLRRKGYRLPTRDEWQFAAAAGATTVWPCGDASLLGAYAYLLPTSEVDGLARTWPVGTLKPNDFGLFDMFGNVAEWCQDEKEIKGVTNTDAQLNPVMKSQLCYVCGGAYVLRPSQVGVVPCSLSRPDFGFRVVRTVPVTR